jgi:hypothetical protein
VPAETIRLQRRLGARDRWFLAVLALALVAATAAALAIGRTSSAGTVRDAGCVSITRASWMGAATFRACGAEAAAFCRRSAGGDRERTAKCERAGFATH